MRYETKFHNLCLVKLCQDNLFFKNNHTVITNVVSLGDCAAHGVYLHATRMALWT